MRVFVTDVPPGPFVASDSDRSWQDHMHYDAEGRLVQVSKPAPLSAEDVEALRAKLNGRDEGAFPELRALADKLGKPAASLSGRALMMARTRNGGINPAGSQPEIDAAKLKGRDLHMYRMKTAAQGGAR